jgi:glycosyltransferase involved in cell wall biosynthesis
MTTDFAREPLRLTLVSFHQDPQGRTPEQLLEAWPTLTALSAALARAGASVTVVQAACGDSSFVRCGVDYRFRSPQRLAPKDGRGAGKLAPARRIVQEVRDACPDAVLVSGLSFPLQTRLLSEALPQTPILVQDHADAPPAGLRLLLRRWGLAKVSGALFTAREQAEPFFQTSILRAGLPIFEVPEASTEFTPGDQIEARAATGLMGDPCLLWLGRLDANKDPLTALAALRSAAKQLPDPHLWCFYTDAELEWEVRRELDIDPQLGRIVHLMGRRPHREVETLCRAADFLVQTSRREGSGYALIEALACGLPPLVTDIPSFRKLTGGGSVGALAKPGDVTGFGRNLVEWSGRDRVALRKRARELFERDLSYEAVVRLLLAACNQVRGAK